MIPNPPLVTVVTPVRNGAKYLAECIESVRSQTYSNWEYVIVNNCSSDETLQIARRYSEVDARIKVHDNAKCLPIMKNWNHALRQISKHSIYCKVLHADDLLFCDCLEEMVLLAERNPSVGLVAGYAVYGTTVLRPPFRERVVDGRQAARAHLLGARGCFGSPTYLLLRSDLVRSRENFYNETNLHGDTEACVDILRSCDFGVVHKVLTFIRKHADSVTSQYANLGTHGLSKYYLLEKYGAEFLKSHEYRRALDVRSEAYARSLSCYILTGNWRAIRYQIEAAARLKVRFGVSRLAGGLLRAVRSNVMEFGRTLRRKR